MSADDAAALSRELIPRVEALRGLTFLSPVPVQVVDDSQAREHFLARIQGQVPAEHMQAQQKAYEQLGLLPPDLDLVKLLLDLLEEQAGGYYDPQSKTFFLLGDMPSAVAPVLMAHELTHALDDQHFGIDEMLDAAMPDDDRVTALNALVEGSGMAVMTAFTAEEMTQGRLDLQALLKLQESEAGQAERLLAAPPVVQRMLMGPYLLGQSFLSGAPREAKPAEPADPEASRSGVLGVVESIVDALGEMDGALGDAAAALRPPPAGAASRAFRDPPVSSEQILHPEKYWDPASRDLPRALPRPDLAIVLGPAWSLQGEGTLGELDLAALTGAGSIRPDSPEALSPSSWTTTAAAGWGGDRWTLLRNGDRNVTVLSTLWDSALDAGEFVASIQKKEHPPVVRWRNDAVVLVAGDAGDRGEALADAALDALAPETKAAPAG